MASAPALHCAQQAAGRTEQASLREQEMMIKRDSIYRKAVNEIYTMQILSLAISDTMRGNNLTAANQYTRTNRKSF